MGAKNFYDAVLIGMSLPTLLAGGLLAKRGFRVLLVSQGQPLPSYEIDGVRLPRSPFTLTPVDSPAVTRVFSELALKHVVQRRIRPLKPAGQAVFPRHRLDLSLDPEQFTHEVEREFPAVRRPADDFMRNAQRAWENINPLVGGDLTWPPMGFFERREFARAAMHQPFGREELGPAPLNELADSHPLRQLVNVILRFADGSALGEQYAQRQLRLFANTLRGAELADGGYAALCELLLESIRTHNGEVRLLDRVDRMTVRRGGIEHVRLAPSDEEVGCHFVLGGLPVTRLARLLGDRTALDQMLDELGKPRPQFLRFTTNILLPVEALPEGMGRNVWLLSGARTLHAEHALRIEADRLSDGQRALLSVECLLPASTAEAGAEALSNLRERVLSSLVRLFPFIRSHLLLLDSPHDGRPVQEGPECAEREPPDVWGRGPETMPVVYAFPRTRVHGTCALPVRTPIKRLLLCNEQVVPGLGLEGSFLTAWSAARTVTRSLNRDWMNRGRWTKVDL